MSTALRRTVAVLVLLSGAALAFYVVFGSPHEWTGGMRLLKFAMGLTAMAMISISARLMFPGTPEDDKDDDNDDASTPPPFTGPLDAL
ncbi:hypothetical protein ACF068_19505 [Streptomyces sp. NPDC016309]|uniref:hypothetical protein n=1 Tax=Streptomyces sp. NPDC016309 TaxID=3364965 RepID=UPI0036F78490